MSAVDHLSAQEFEQLALPLKTPPPLSEKGRLIHRSNRMFRPGEAVLPPTAHQGSQNFPYLAGQDHAFAAPADSDNVWDLGYFAYDVEPITQDYSDDPAWEGAVRSNKGFRVKGLAGDRMNRYAVEDYTEATKQEEEVD